MKAITTRTLSATNTRGTRIRATDGDGNSQIVAWDHSQNAASNHHGGRAMKLTRAQRDILWADFRADDSGRATALEHWFAVADIVYHADPDAVPHAWRFGHGASGRDCLAEMLECQAATGHDDCDCPWPDSIYAPFVEAGPYGVHMLVHAGDVLGRYVRRHYCDECELTRSKCECWAESGPLEQPE